VERAAELGVHSVETLRAVQLDQADVRRRLLDKDHVAHRLLLSIGLASL
jgi:hypothetical protein